MTVPIFSPNLQIWCTKLNDNLLFSGCIGVNPSVIDRKNDFPRFVVVVPKNLSNNQIIEYVTSKGQQLIRNIKNVGTGTTTPFISDQTVCKGTECDDGYFRNFPFCGMNFNGMDHDEMDFSHANSDDRVAILFSPSTGEHEILLHSPIYQSTYSENISYTRSDSKNLEKFLLKESSVPASKRLCLEHRAKCQACEIINRTDHAAQSQLINNMYNNISAYKLPDGNFR